VETDQEKITIRDPFPVKRRLMIVPAVDWNEVKHLFVDVLYEDQENGIRESLSVSFNKDEANPKEVVLQQFKNPEHRILRYKVIMIFADGRVLEPPPSLTLTDRAIITTQMRGHQIVAVTPEAVPFKSKKIKDVEIRLKAEDGGAGLSFNDVYTFHTPEDRTRYFEYDFADPEEAAYEYQLTFRYDNGLKRATDWKKTSEEVLKVLEN
jgi:hypothetical protein